MHTCARHGYDGNLCIISLPDHHPLNIWCPFLCVQFSNQMKFHFLSKALLLPFFGWTLNSEFWIRIRHYGNCHLTWHSSMWNIEASLLCNTFLQFQYLNFPKSLEPCTYGWVYQKLYTSSEQAVKARTPIHHCENFFFSQMKSLLLNLFVQ